MGCNCKNKVKNIEKKYGDNGEVIEPKPNIFLKIIKFFAQILFGVVCGIIIIPMALIMVLYLIFCLMFGKEPHFRVYDIQRRLSKKRE